MVKHIRQSTRGPKSQSKEPVNKRFRLQYAIKCLLLTAGFWLLIIIQSQTNVTSSDLEKEEDGILEAMSLPQKHRNTESKAAAMTINKTKIEGRRQAVWDPAWEVVVDRAKQKRDFCTKDEKHSFVFDTRHEMNFGIENKPLATLPPFGIIDAIESWKKNNPEGDAKWSCKMPPENECGETQLTVVFMAYNPDRLGITMKEIRKLLSRDNFQNLVKECVLVWNGPRNVDDSKAGKELLEFAKQEGSRLRVVYPLKMGFPNDLMNRYHPDVVKVTTKAILYYDDDGPFYSFKAIESGFELFKRHPRVQIGAMSRHIDYSPRQSQELEQLDPNPNDRLFISHCDNLKDKVEYNFRYFANYDANMVLPSGSMLHSNYLCFLWHPALEPIRKFVLAHPVHPDDITVSTVVSHLAGQAPRVYSRRLNPEDQKRNAVGLAAKKRRRRRLEESETEEEEEKKEEEKEEEERLIAGGGSDTVQVVEEAGRNKGGIGGICWDCGAGMTEKKQLWADLRSQAINSLIRYFGSINSGSIGWCEGTQFYDAQRKDGRCTPIMARQGWLLWMKPDGTPKDTCP